MKMNFFRMILECLTLAILACLAWCFSAVSALCSRASYGLTRLRVSKTTRDIFDGKTTFGRVYGPPDYRQKVIDLLNGESEPIVGYVREIIEKTQPGRLAVRHVSDRHVYAVLVPTKAENIQRVLNVFDTFPKDACENAYTVIEWAIQNFHYSGMKE